MLNERPAATSARSRIPPGHAPIACENPRMQSPRPAALPDLGLSPVPSPCISVCKMNATTGWCEGCLRTIDEIAGWSGMSDDARRLVWAELARRRGQKAA